MVDKETPSRIHFEQSSDDPRILILQLPTASANPPQPFSLRQAEKYAIMAMCGGPTDHLYRAFEAINEDSRAYGRVLEAALSCEHPSDGFYEPFHLAWTVGGFRHRADIQDDDLLIRAFRRIFPRYEGPALVLYRGERASEFEMGRLGLNWSTDPSVAKTFAAGLCTTYGCDGVMLTATAAPSTIITGPNDHSANWLREVEHIVDPKMLSDVTEVARFPPTF